MKTTFSDSRVGAARGPALERHVLEIDHLLHVAGERPVEANGPGEDLAHRLRGIDQAGVDARAVELEAVHPQRQLERAPLTFRGVEGPLGAHARVSGLVRREGERRRRLPGARLQAVAAAVGLLHLRVGLCVLGQQTEASVVERQLRRIARAGPVRGDTGEDADHADLPAGAVGGQRTRLLAGGAGDPEPEVLEEGAASPERRHEHAAREILAVVQVAVDAAAVGRPVEDARRVGEDAARELAVDLDPEVAIRDDRGRERALDEVDRRGRLQALEAHGRLVLADLDLQPRRGLEVQPGVLEHRDASAEVGHHAKLEVAAERALQDRPHAAQGEGVDRERALVAREEAAVELDVAAELQAVVAAVVLQAEAVGAGRDRKALLLRRLLAGRLGRLGRRGRRARRLRRRRSGRLLLRVQGRGGQQKRRRRQRHRSHSFVSSMAGSKRTFERVST